MLANYFTYLEGNLFCVDNSLEELKYIDTLVSLQSCLLNFATHGQVNPHYFTLEMLGWSESLISLMAALVSVSADFSMHLWVWHFFQQSVLYG